MAYYVVLKDNQHKATASYTAEDFKALTVEDGKRIKLTVIESEKDAMASAENQSTDDNAFVVFAITLHKNAKVKDGSINAHYVTFDSAIAVQVGSTLHLLNVTIEDVPDDESEVLEVSSKEGTKEEEPQIREFTEEEYAQDAATKETAVKEDVIKELVTQNTVAEDVVKDAEPKKSDSKELDNTDVDNENSTSENSPRGLLAAMRNGLKPVLNLAVFLAVCSAVLVFSGILPVAGIAAKIVLGAMIPTGAIAAVYIAAKAVSSSVKIIENHFSFKIPVADILKKFVDKKLPQPNFTKEEQVIQNDNLQRKLDEMHAADGNKTEDALRHCKKGILFNREGKFIVREDGTTIAPNTVYSPKKANENEADNKEETKNTSVNKKA